MFNKKILSCCVSASLLLFSASSLSKESGGAAESLTDTEIEMIESRKDALLYLLMEKNELEPLLNELREQERKQAAEREINEQFKYTEEQIRRRRELSLDYEKAFNSPISKKTVKISEEDYDPDGSTPIYIKVAANNPSSIAFFDYQGKPWPIVGDVIGDNGAFQSYPFAENKNTAVFQIKEMFSETVALVNLQGIDQLVVVKLVGDESEFDARKNIRIPRRGPLSDDTIVSNKSNVTYSDPILIQILNGEKVAGGIEYYGDWDDESVFVRLNDVLYVRTKDSITYPPSLASQKSANGYNLYKTDFSNTLIIKRDGQDRIITISNKRDGK
tara:strand:+ start:188 stop:1177 length:990 start_codon:yes stop_codon:yes gene_type:complete